MRPIVLVAWLLVCACAGTAGDGGVDGVDGVADTDAPEAAAADTSPEALAADASPPDLAADAPPADVDASAPPAFAVSVMEWVGSNGGADSAYASASRSWGDELPGEVVATAGDCAFVRPVEPPLCDPPCAAGTVCVAADTCGPPFEALGAGDIVLDGLTVGCTLHPETQYHYYSPVFDPEPPDGDVFDEGDVLTATAPGDDVPAFTVTTLGVARVESPLGCPPVYSPGDGLEVTWTAGRQPGDRLSFVVMSGNHGTQFSRVLCETDDTGHLHVDAKLYESYLADWHPMNSWRLTRRHEGSADVPGVHVTFTASSQAGCMW